MLSRSKCPFMEFSVSRYIYIHDLDTNLTSLESNEIFVNNKNVTVFGQMTVLCSGADICGCGQA